MFLRTRPIISLILIICAYIFLFNINSLALGSRLSLAKRPRRLRRHVIKHDIARYKALEHRGKARPLGPLVPSNPRRKTLLNPLDVEDDPPIDERVGPLQSTIEGSVKLPMYAAADYEMGQYLVDLDVGTPPQKLRMVVDVGSDLTWVKCKDIPPGRFKDERGFEAGKSSTFSPIPCSTTLCKDDFALLDSQDICPSVNAPCLYNFSYGEGTTDLRTHGMFGKEKATLPTTTKTTTTLEQFLIGCSDSYMGRKDMRNVDGVLGLGVNPYSFGVHAVNKYGGTFSYCLVDHLSPTNLSSYLVFGEDKLKAPTTEFMRYTMLFIDEEAPFFWVYLKGITIGEKMLDIPTDYWLEDHGGTILDSGTSLTYLTLDAYRTVMDSLISFLSKNHPKRPETKGNGVEGFEYCFNSSTYPLNISEVPKLEIHFADGAKFMPHVKSYIVDDAPDIKCIGILQAQGGLNIIGNIMQQNYLWEFDLHHKSIGFAPSTCN